MADPVPQASNVASNLAVGNLSQYANAQADPLLQRIMSQYASGQMSLAQAQQALQGANQTGQPGYNPGSHSIGSASNVRDPGSIQADIASTQKQLDDYRQSLGGAGMDPRIMSVNPAVATNVNTYQQKLQDLNDELNKANSAQPQVQANQPISNGLYNEGMLNALLTNASTGSKAASEFVRTDALTKGLFGEGGIQDQAQSRYGQLNSNYDQDYSRIPGLLDRVTSLDPTLDQDRQSLLGRDQSYGLTPEDLAAYGQAAGNITRQFGASANNLSQDMADRGFGGAPSGMAPQAFSGLLGSQNEQLAGAQLKIAQSRIQTAQGLAQARMTADLQRQSQANDTLGQGISLLGQDTSASNANNSLINGLGTLGQNAVANQYQRQLAGAENSYNTLAGSAGMQMQNLGLNQNILNTTYGLENSNNGPSLGSILGGALGGAVGIGGGIAVGKALK